MTGSNDESLDDVRRRVEFDLEYIARGSALQNLTIMARTMPVMIRGIWSAPMTGAFSPQGGNWASTRVEEAAAPSPGDNPWLATRSGTRTRREVE